MTAFEWWRNLYASQGRRALATLIYEPRQGSYGGVENEALVFFGKDPTDWPAFCADAAKRGNRNSCEVAVDSLDAPCHYAFVDFVDHTPEPWKRKAMLRTNFPELGDWTFFDSGRSYHAVAEKGIPFRQAVDPGGVEALSKYLYKLRRAPGLGVDTGWCLASEQDGRCILRLTRNDEKRFLKVPEVVTS